MVIVSYKDREEDRIRGLDAGANFYLTKSSFHDQTFLTTVADLIGEPQRDRRPGCYDQADKLHKSTVASHGQEPLACIVVSHLQSPV